MKLEDLKKEGSAPEWMDEVSFETLKNGYLLDGETPAAMWKRVSKASADKLKMPKLANEFFQLFWKGWLGAASPVLSNMGTERGLPISCNTIHVDDSVDSIFKKNYELAVLSKNGAGVGIYIGDIRGRGVKIKGNGTSEGIVPWAKLYDTTTSVINQGATRRGASALYLPIEHLDIDEFINIRRPTGDINRRCLNTNHGIVISDKWMNEMMSGDVEKRKLWEKVLITRVETGEPYLMFVDNANNQAPECYKKHNLSIKSSNICNEIYQHTDSQHTFVCCLSSMNLAKWDEWKDTNACVLAIYFLDGVMEEYIEKASKVVGLECAVRSAVKSRSLGLGVMGWHTLLQSKNIPFDSFESMMLNSSIFRHIRKQAEQATKEMAEKFGEPEWCKGFGIRNALLMAVAPTVSNATISGGISSGIEPIVANVFIQKSAKGNFIRKNKHLEQLLESKKENTPETWKSINENKGSVQHLSFLSDNEKKVFLTAREINQFAIVKQAAQRQRWIDQGQSVNLFFAANSDPKYIHDVHLEAWRSGLKGLYYLRSEGVLKGDMASRSKEECEACSG